jgi:hypothetical protein
MSIEVYDVTYKLNGGKTSDHVVPPERVLGRKMTEEDEDQM